MSLCFLMSRPAAASIPALNDASAAYNNGQIDFAQNQIFSALKSEPNTYLKPEFVLLLAATYLAGGEPQQAQAVLDALMEEFPIYRSDANAIRIQAALMEGRGELEKAQALLGKNPSGEALYHLAVLLDHSGQTFAAVTRYKELLDSAPPAPLALRARLGLASAYLRLNNAPSAEAALNAVDVPSDPQVRSDLTFLKAVSAFENSQPAAGREQLSQLPDSAVQLKAFGSTFGGVSALAASDAPGAAAFFQVGLSTGTAQNRLLAAVGLSAADLQMGQPEKVPDAINAVLPSLAVADQDRLLLIRGVAAQRANQMETALADFDTVIRRKNSAWRARALALAAHTLWYNNQYARLVTDFSKTLVDARASLVGKAAAPLSATDAENLNICDLLIANANYSLRRYHDGELLYRDILRRAPSKNLTAEAVSGLVACQIFQKKFADAQKALDELMVRFGEDRDVVRFGLSSQANLNWNQERYAKALEQYQKYLEMFPSDERAPFCLYQIGRCQQRLGDNAAALASWTELRSKAPASPYAFNALARSAQAAEALGNKAIAEKLYAETSRSSDSSVAETALVAMGRQQLDLGCPTEAIESLDALSKRFPLAAHRAESDRMLRDAYQRVALSQPEQLAELAAKYQSSYHAGEAAYQQGVIAFDRGDYKLAAELFKKTWSSYPRTPSAGAAMFYHGESLYRLGDYEGAVASLHEFLLNNPGHDMANPARLRIAKSLEALGQSEEAAKNYRALIAKSPQSETAAQASVGLALALDRLSQYDEEATVCRTFLKQYPDHARANSITWRVAQLERRAGTYDLALADFKRVHAENGVATDDEIKQTIASLESLAQAGAAEKTQ
jgi:TolA-binding protein